MLKRRTLILGAALGGLAVGSISSSWFFHQRADEIENTTSTAVSQVRQFEGKIKPLLELSTKTEEQGKEISDLKGKNTALENRIVALEGKKNERRIEVQTENPGVFRRLGWRIRKLFH
jgi:hypothetical protein